MAHAWYEGSASLHPWEGETKPEYTDFLDNGKYTWCKAPRLRKFSGLFTPSPPVSPARCILSIRKVILVAEMAREGVILLEKGAGISHQEGRQTRP